MAMGESWRSWRCGWPPRWLPRSPVAPGRRAAPSRRDARRVSDALRRIEAAAQEPLALADLARETATSPYHFLRTFRQVVGMTPHQFVLHTRLTRAAVRLRTTGDPISSIAFDTGFGDLSTFNRRFRRLMGCSPGAYRSARRNSVSAGTVTGGTVTPSSSSHGSATVAQNTDASGITMNRPRS